MKIKIPTVKNYQNLTLEKGRLIGHCIGDGAVYKTNTDYVIKYEVKDFFLIKQFFYDLINIYGLEPHLVLNRSGKTGNLLISVRLRSKIVYNDLLRYVTSYYSAKWKIQNEIMNSSKLIKREFLKALYDDEGSIRSRKCVFLYSINEQGLFQVKEILNEFKIDSTIKSGFGCRKNVFALSVSDVISFREKIGFNLPRKKNKLNDLLK